MTQQAETWLNRFVEMLIRFRFLLLPLVIILVAMAYPVANRLSFDQSIESLYAEDDPHLLDYLESKSLFGGDEFLFVAYQQEKKLFLPNSLEISQESKDRILQLTDQIETSVPGINIKSLQNLVKSMRFRFGRKQVRKMVEGVLVGKDNRTTAIVVRLLDEDETNANRSETFSAVRKIADSHHPEAYVVGEPVQVFDMFRYVEEDGKKLFVFSLCLLGLVLFVFFRSLQWVILPLVVVVASIVWTEAVLVLTRVKLSMVSSMLNSLVTIIGVATVTHVTVHYRENRRTLDRQESLRKTLTDLLPPIFWTSATTAIGFGALLSSDITPVKSFGLMMAMATGFVLVASATVLPGGILLGRLSDDPRNAPAEKRLTGLLAGISDWVEHRPLVLSLSALAIVLFAAIGFSRLEVETDFSKNFRKNTPIVQAINFIETNLGGAGTWEVNFPAPHQPDEEFFTRVAGIAERLNRLGNKAEPNAAAVESSDPASDNTPQLTKVVSLTDGLSLVPKLPFITNTLEKRLRLLNSFQPDYETTLYNRKAGRMRIMLRAKERQSAKQKLKLIASVEEAVRREFPEIDPNQIKATGLFVLLAFLIDNLLRDQLVSFAFAAVGIGTMMTIAFRSLRIGLISLIPNLFPIVLVIGAMGWVGLPINIATAMIASVSMGLTVDSSIHFLSAYRRARSRGDSVIDAIRDCHQGVGRALVFANLALIVGFSVLTWSHFIPLVYFGILVSVALFGGLVGNLVLLPLLIRCVDRESPVEHCVSGEL